MSAIKEKTAGIIANQLEHMLLTKYPRPTKVILDRVMEFMAEVISLLRDNWNIKRKPITARNLQVNAILQRAHQTIGNIIHTFQSDKTELEKENPWEGILSAVIFAMQSTVHTTLGATPMQLVFSQDAVLKNLHKVNWKLIKKCKQELDCKNNTCKNEKRRSSHVQIRGFSTSLKWAKIQNTVKMCIKVHGPLRKLIIMEPLTLKKGIFSNIINIQNIHPYVTSDDL